MTAQTDIDKLAKKIESTNDYFVVSAEKDFVIAGCWKIIKMRVEKSGNIFQPFGKNIEKQIPIFFPVALNKKNISKNKIIKNFYDRCEHKLYIHKPVLNSNKEVFENILDTYIYKFFKEDD